MPKLTHARLLEVLHYDPLTGIFTWIKNTGKKQLIGTKAGTLQTKGYIGIGIDGESFRGQRLAWFYMNGVWPTATADHENGIKNDNRIVNIRDITQKANVENQLKTRSDSVSSIKGVRYRISKRKYQARIRVNKVEIHIGYYDDPQEAHQAYLERKRLEHPSFSG